MADDLPDAPWATNNDDSDLPDAPWAHSSPEDSSQLGTAAREIAHAAIPVTGGVLSGMAVGAALGTMGAGPVGTLVGGVAGGIVGGAALEKGEDWLLDKMGWRDKAQEQADQEQHPWIKAAAGAIPAALTLHPSGSMIQRGLGAAIGGGAAAVQGYMENGEIDPANVLAGAGMGAAFPSANRIGAAAERVGGRVGARLSGKSAPNSVDPSAPAEAPSRDLKLAPDEYTDEAPVGSADNPELTAAQAILGKLDPRDPMRTHIESYIDELSKAPKQSDGQATPSTPPTVSRGVSESRPAPSQDPTITGNENGAPMLQREGARPSDPVRDYRKNKPAPADQVQGQESVPLSTDAMHPDIAAALSPTEAQSTFRQKTVTQPQGGEPEPQPAQQFHDPWADTPQPPVQTGLPQAQPQRLNPQQMTGLIKQASQRALRRPIVETPMPSGANSSKNINGPVYVDPSVPAELRRPVAVHETVEQTLMAQGMPYEQAHEHATVAEEAVVRAAGMDVNQYRAQWDGILKNVEHQPYDPASAPKDMHVDPEQAIGHYAGRNGDAPVETGLPKALPTSPPGRVETGITAAVTNVRNKLNAVGFNKALEAFNAMSPEDQAAEAPKFLALTENTRAARKSETGVGYRSEAHRARIEGSTAAVTKAVEELKPGELSLERTPENKAAIREHAEDLYERAKELYGDKDPVKYVKGDETSGYVPAQPTAAHNLVTRARKIALNPKATWATLEDYVHAVALKGDTGQKVDAGIAMSKRPTVEDAEGGTVQDQSRESFEPVADVAAGKDNSYVEAQNRLRDYVNDLSPADYKTLENEHDIRMELDEPADPQELLANFKQTLAAAGGRRPGRIELVPAEDVEGGKRTRVTDAAGVDRFKPTEEGAAAGVGKSLKGTPEFEALAAKYGGMKAPDRTGRLEAEEGAAKAPEKPLSGSWDAVTEMANKFLGDEGGGGKVPDFIKNFFERDPYDPSSQHRSDQVTTMLDQYPKWFKAHSNLRAGDKGQIAGNAIKAAAMDLPKNDWAKIDQAYQTKGERALPGPLKDAAKEVVDPLLTKGNALYKELYDMDQSDPTLRLNLPAPHDGFDVRYMPRQKIGEDISDKENQNVVSGNNFSSWASSLQAREYMGLRDNATGNRLVLHVGDDGKFSIVQGGNFRPLTKLPADFTGAVGETMPLYSGGKKTTFTVDHAATDEIEAATKGGKINDGKGETYQKNPIVTLSNWVNQLQAAKANIETMQKIKNDPLWLNNTTTEKDVAAKRGYDLIPTKLDQLGKKNGAQVYMPRNVRWMIDDAHRQGFGGDDANFLRSTGSGLARIFMTFGSPIHVANVATNAIIGRGFDNITPQGLRSLGVTGVRAFKAVNDAANSKDYGDFLKAGGRPQFLSTITNDLIPNIARRMGADVAQNTSKWDPIAKIWGISTPDMARAVENFSTKEMWRLSDMMAVQRFLENRDFKGMSPEDAAADVHKFIPAYDLPSTVGPSGKVGRLMSQALADPAVSLFGRYHMDLLRSYAHVTRNVFGASSTPTERMKGVGQMLAAAGLAYLAYPALDKLAQKVSGNEGAEMGRRGMLSIPDTMSKMGKGDSDYSKLATQLFTPSIPASMFMKGITNTTWNRKQIVQQMPLNSARNVAKAGAQAGDWAAQNIVPPYGNIAGDLTKGNTVAGTAGKFAAGMVGVRLPSDKSRNYEAHLDQINQRAMRTREKNPGGPLEWVANTFGR